MHQALHFDNRFGALAAGVVTSPLAIGPFALSVRSGMTFTFDGDFRIGGNRQTRMFAENNVDRLAANTAQRSRTPICPTAAIGWRRS